jgi:hypothetical protein
VSAKQEAARWYYRVENTSKDFAAFYPQRVSFVDRDNNQVAILDARHG